MLRDYKINVAVTFVSFTTTRKKGFNEGYLAEVDITLGIDLINGGFLTFVKFQRLFKNLSKIAKLFLTFIKFQRFILKP